MIYTYELLSEQAAPAHRSTILIMTRTAPRYSHKILIKPIVGSRSGGVHADVYLPARPASAPIGEFALLRIPDAGMLLMDVCCLQRSVSTAVDSPWGKARGYRPTRWSGYWRTGTPLYRSNIDSLLSMRAVSSCHPGLELTCYIVQWNDGRDKTGHLGWLQVDPERHERDDRTGSGRLEGHLYGLVRWCDGFFASRESESLKCVPYDVAH
jgi:hypothetical protein